MPGMICAPQPAAVETGALVLAAGGNAFDAAIAAAAVQFLVDPHSCGIGGYALLTAHRADKPGESIALDAAAFAGSRTWPEMWEKIVIQPNPGGWGYFLEGKVNDDGFLSVCTPGTALGLELMHRRWGSQPWRSLLTPAIELAHIGWQVGAHLAARWKERPMFYEGSSAFEKLHASPEAERIYLKPDGTTLEAHEILRNPDYGRTLERVAEGGADEFYRGELGRELAADLERHGSWVTAADLAAYQALDVSAVIGTYRGYDVHSAPAPHGGPTLLAILNILEHYDLAAMGHNSPEFILTVSLAMKAAFADRNRYLGDPRVMDVREDWMTSKGRAAEWVDRIRAGEVINAERVQPGAPDTTHVSVVDRWGNCVSLTHSLGSSSGAITPGTGFMWNNSMVNFHPYPGHANSIAPGKARTTGMAPTVVYRDGSPVLVLGAPGATRILTSVLQVILNRIDFGMSVTDAVHAPRFDCQEGAIQCQARIPEYVCSEVRKRHPILRIPRSHGGLALVHAVARDPQSGQLTGAADTGADGMALLVP